MADFKRTSNPQVLPSKRVRAFEGIGGNLTQVLQRINYKGWDTSDTVSNQAEDCSLDEQGSLLVRNGCRKVRAYTHDINWLGVVRIGGLLRVGLIADGKLDLIPYDPFIDIPIEEDADLPEPTYPTTYPSTWRKKKQKQADDVPLTEPSLPIEEQICEINWTWTAFPLAITFTMPYGGAIPTSQNWYWSGLGFRPWGASGTYSTAPAWMDVYLLQGYAWDIAECQAFTWGGMNYAPNGKDADDNWLVPTTYTYNASFSLSDGTVLTSTITLAVKAPNIGRSPTSKSFSCWLSDTTPQTQVIAITNTGETGSITRWTSAISGDTALTALLSLDVTSGELDYNESENTTLTLANPSALTAGTYNASILFSEPSGKSVDFPVTLTVKPIYTGNLKVTVIDNWSRPPAERYTYVYTYPYRTSGTPPEYIAEYRINDDNVIRIQTSNGGVICFNGFSDAGGLFYLRHPEYKPWLSDYSPSATVLPNSAGAPVGEYINIWYDNAGNPQMVGEWYDRFVRNAKVIVEQIP